MNVRWADWALDDLERVYDFLADKNKPAANRIKKDLKEGARQLADDPRLGRQLFSLLPEEIRQIVIDDYIVRYQIDREIIYIVHIWHGREDWPYDD
jgi:plasmid stabilization system protein ParE